MVCMTAQQCSNQQGNEINRALKTTQVKGLVDLSSFLIFVGNNRGKKTRNTPPNSRPIQSTSTSALPAGGRPHPPHPTHDNPPPPKFNAKPHQNTTPVAVAVAGKYSRSIHVRRSDYMAMGATLAPGSIFPASSSW